MLFFLFLLWGFKIDNVIYPPGRQKSWKSHYFKNHSRNGIFFLEIQLIFSVLSIGDYGQVVLSSGMWTKQKQTLERQSSNFMAVSVCSGCQYLWCHNQIKTILSAIYISTIPRLHKFMPMFLSRFKTIQMLGLLETRIFTFTFLLFLSMRESELSSLTFILKSVRIRKHGV